MEFLKALLYILIISLASSVLLLSMLNVTGLMIFLQQLECDPWDTMDEGRKLIVDFNIGKTGLASFNRSVNSRSIHVKK